MLSPTPEGLFLLLAALTVDRAAFGARVAVPGDAVPDDDWLFQKPVKETSFQGGHAENIINDEENCEFKKSHGVDHMDRYEVEVDFLKRATEDPLWRLLVPQYLREEQHGGRPFCVMRSLTCGIESPVIADLKLGTQSWKPDFNGIPGADEAKRAKMDKLDRASTTKQLGVRATSVQMPPDPSHWEGGHAPSDPGAYQLGGRAAVKKGLASGDDAWKSGSTVAEFEMLLKAYLPTPALRTEFLEKLAPFIETFSFQSTYRFTGLSLFVWYDARAAGSGDPKLGMAMIDFPHTLGSPSFPYGELDSGVLKGLTSLRDIVTALDADAETDERAGHTPGRLPVRQISYQGGHAENIINDDEACEFKKSHGVDHMDRYEVEVDFLKRATEDPLWRLLVPQYLREEQHGGRPFCVMRSLTCGIESPVIADLKLGTQSWKPDFHGRPGADEAKRTKMDKLDRASTTKQLGVRATSIQMPPDPSDWEGGSAPSDQGAYQLGGRAAVKQGLASGDDAWKSGSTVEEFEMLLKAYLPTTALRMEFLVRLTPFIETFSFQKTYRFTELSLFVWYDARGAGGEDPKLGMAMIDFPHTLGSPGEEYGELDSGVLKGLTSLRDIVASLDAVEG